MSTFTPNDPLWTSQWYLNNTGQRGGAARLDLKLMAAWSQGFNGQGVRVAINDDGFDLTHPDLVANIDASKVYDTNRDLTGKGFVTSRADAHQHGTVVGSIVGMAANGIGGIGIAYKATLIPGIAVYILDDAPPNGLARLFAANLAAGADVSVNSFGRDSAFSTNFGESGDDGAFGDQLLKAATEGRAGLGMVIEKSAGNERSAGADAGLDNFTNNKVAIAVGAVDETGKVTSYSNPGACLLVTAFGGMSSEDHDQDTGFGIVSADMQGAAGYNKTSGVQGDYAYQNVGTSYSGPMVGAAAALMLQANPHLGFRDVSAILAMTARQTDSSNASWVTNGATHWNLGGMHFSRDYGYGLVDISAAVMLAQSWVPAAATMANWIKAESGPRTAVVQAIPDDATRSLSVTAQVADVVRIDRVEFDLNLTAVSPSQLKAEITSPNGTTVTLFDRPLTRALKDGEPDPASEETPWPDTFTIGSTAFLGETSAGTWTLKLTDLVSGVQSTFNSLTVRAWGAALSANDQYVLTDEYKGNKTLTDASGLDTINAAAVSHAVQLDLRDSGVSRVGTAGGTLAWGTGTVIENAIGGMAADTLTGNSGNNSLRGNGGADTIDGGAGADTLIGGPGDDSLVGGNGLDSAVLNFARSVYTLSVTGQTWVVTNTTGTDGRDEVSGVERLKFSDSWTALDLGASDSAGSAVLLIGAVLGKDLMLSKRPLMGSVIDLFDQGYTIQQLAGALMRLPIWAGTLTPTNSSTDIATYLLTRVNGKAPTATELAAAVKSIDTDVQGTFLANLALTQANIAQVDLVGLSKTGFDYPLAG
ncbi:MAG: S8 family serine peptidase [Betaproteobacteria bacterium]|jgi:subtilisin-like proprotein convertase family protein